MDRRRKTAELQYTWIGEGKLGTTEYMDRRRKRYKIQGLVSPDTDGKD